MAAFVEKLENGKWCLTAGHDSLDLCEVVEDWDMKDLARAIVTQPEFKHLVVDAARKIRIEEEDKWVTDQR